jgi:hypothetical protein
MFVSGVKEIPSALLAGLPSASSNGRVRADALCENQYREVGLREGIRNRRMTGKPELSIMPRLS